MILEAENEDVQARMIIVAVRWIRLLVILVGIVLAPALPIEEARVPAFELEAGLSDN